MEKKLKTSPAQARARDKWNKNNKEKRKKYTVKSSAKRYIRDFVKTAEEIEEVEKWLEEARKNLKVE
jgi:hypothetical protein